MPYQLVTQVSSGVIAFTFLLVALLILRGMLRARKMRSNALGMVVALVFLAAAAHRVALVLPTIAGLDPGASIMAPLNAGIDVVAGLLGLGLLPLESRFGALALPAPSRRRRRKSKGLPVSRTDSVTGLPGGQQAREFLTGELRDAVHSREHVCLLMVPLDPVQRPQEDAVQPVDDKLLVHVGALLRDQLRTQDYSARSGPSEFMLVMPAVDREAAFRIAQRLEVKIQRLIVDLLIENPVAVCTGISTCPEDATDAEGMIAAAEEAMNYSRRLGGGHFFFSEDVGLLEAGNEGCIEPITDTTQLSVKSLLAALAAHDQETAAHSERVAKYSVAVAGKLSYPAEDMPLLRIGALLHDIGMIGVSPEILRKPGRLTASEYLEIRRHPVIGYEMTRNLPGCQVPSIYVLYHHETWQGHGYPEALREEEIPLASRIIAVAEAFDMMHSRRPHRKALPIAECRKRLLGGAGSQFDPAVVAAMLDVASRQFPAGSDGESDSPSNRQRSRRSRG